MKIKKNNPVFLFDVDRTLTNTKKEITPFTAEVLRKIQEKYVVGLATGRSYATLKRYILPFFNENTIHIVSGGGQIVTNNGEILWQKNIPNKFIKQIYERLPGKKDGLIFSKEDSVYMADNLRKETKENPWDFDILKIDEKEFYDLPMITIYKLSEKMISYLKSLNSVSCKFMESYSGDMFVDITASGVNKATSIKKWAKLNKINPNNIISFGDSENDLELVSEANKGIAMGNAVSQVKNVADEIIDHTDNDGLAKYLERYL